MSDGGLVPVGDLHPGDRFTTTAGTSWEVERHAGDVVWCVRVAVPGEVILRRDGELLDAPVAPGERDRFAAGALVEAWA